jgi:hypothetical protein
MKNRFSRVHSSIVVAIIAVAGSTGACNQPGSPVHPSSAPTPQLGAAGPSLPDGTFPVSAELAEVRRATAQFHSISAAMAAGYTTEHEPCVAVPGLGAMGVHARHETYMGDQVIDPRRPELLLYEPRPNGTLRLVGVEYFEAALVRDPESIAPPAPWFDPQKWPSDWEVVTPSPQLFGQPFDEVHPGHIPQMPWHWDLHVWIWAPNPDGIFSAFNPAIRCQ